MGNWKIVKGTADYTNSRTKRLREQGVNGIHYTVQDEAGKAKISCADEYKLAVRLCAALNDGKRIYHDILPRTMNADLKRLGY